MNYINKYHKIILLLVGAAFFSQCSLLGLDNKSYDGTKFSFKNYTETDFDNSTISVAKITGNKVDIRYIEKIQTINKKEDRSYKRTDIPESDVWEDKFFDFMNSSNDTGCLLIEISDEKIFIETKYFNDIGSYIIYDKIIEVEINESGLYSDSTSNSLNDIDIEDMVIVR